MLEYNIVVGAGPTSPPNDYGIVAVIDGSKQIQTFHRIRCLNRDRKPKNYSSEACQYSSTNGFSGIDFEQQHR